VEKNYFYKLMNCFSFNSSGKKRASIIHKFIDGTIISPNPDSPSLIPVDDTLTLDHSIEPKTDEQSSTSMCESDIPIPECCRHCGK
jgi:hypothetical protein